MSATTFKTSVKTMRTDGTYKVYIRITHDRKIAYISTDMHVHKNKVKGKDVVDHTILGKCSRTITEYMKRLNLEDTKSWSINDIKKFLETENTNISFTDYCKTYVDKLYNENRSTTAIGYKAAIASFKQSFGESVDFQYISSEGIKKWIKSLQHTARAKESYPKAIKAIFSAGCLEFNDYNKGIIRISNDPFKGVKIPKHDLAKPTPISPETIRKILDFAPTSKQTEMARDVAKLVICLAGINTTDIFQLTKSNIHNGKICYNRSKTRGNRRDNAYFEISIRPEIKKLFTKYNKGERIFDFGYKDMRGFNKYANMALKKICNALEIEPVDTYTFRYSFATIAKNECGFSEEMVAFALNHQSAHIITAGYIEKDYSIVDNLVNTVVDYILYGKTDETEAERKQSEEMTSNILEYKLICNRLYEHEVKSISDELTAKYSNGLGENEEYEMNTYPFLKLTRSKFVALMYVCSKQVSPKFLKENNLDFEKEYKIADKLFSMKFDRRKPFSKV